ncbi:MAG: hypothetical protein SWC96_06770 [Thermodesulfobacteriota bacterium]|nr:hypothetical protein [Thermodesulfobacteriota bacterium]
MSRCCTCLSGPGRTPRRFKGAGWLFDRVSEAEYGVVRDDTRYRGSLGIEKDLYRDMISAGAGYIYTDNDSNIANYKYRGQEFRLFLSARM